MIPPIERPPALQLLSLKLRHRYAGDARMLRANLSAPVLSTPHQQPKTIRRQSGMGAAQLLNQPIVTIRNMSKERQPHLRGAAHSARRESNRSTEKSQTRNTAVRIDVETYVSRSGGRRNIEVMPRVRLDRSFADDLFPF